MGLEELSMREVAKYLSGGVIVYFVMAACSAGGSGGGRRAGNDMDAAVGGNVTSSNGGTGAGNGGTGQSNAGTSPGTGGSFIVDPVPPAMAQTNGETITHSGVVDVACAAVGTATTTITQTNPADNSVISTTTITGTGYEAAINDAAVTLGAIRYAFVQMQGPPASSSSTDICSVYANTPNVTCTSQSTIPPASQGAWMPNIGEGKISVSCGSLSETTTTVTGQAPSTTTTDTRWQSAKFSYGTAS
jgi:hypothetical protein